MKTNKPVDSLNISKKHVQNMSLNQHIQDGDIILVSSSGLNVNSWIEAYVFKGGYVYKTLDCKRTIKQSLDEFQFEDIRHKGLFRPEKPELILSVLEKQTSVNWFFKLINKYRHKDNFNWNNTFFLYSFLMSHFDVKWTKEIETNKKNLLIRIM